MARSAHLDSYGALLVFVVRRVHRLGAGLLPFPSPLLSPLLYSLASSFLLLLIYQFSLLSFYTFSSPLSSFHTRFSWLFYLFFFSVRFVLHNCSVCFVFLLDVCKTSPRLGSFWQILFTFINVWVTYFAAWLFSRGFIFVALCFLHICVLESCVLTFYFLYVWTSVVSDTAVKFHNSYHSSLHVHSSLFFSFLYVAID